NIVRTYSPLIYRHPSNADAGAGHLVTAIDGNEDRGERLGSSRVLDAAGIKAAHAHLRAQGDCNVASRAVVAADENVAVDAVIDIVEMARRDVLKRGDHQHAFAEQTLADD